MNTNTSRRKAIKTAALTLVSLLTAGLTSSAVKSPELQYIGSGPESGVLYYMLPGNKSGALLLKYRHSAKVRNNLRQAYLVYTIDDSSSVYTIIKSRTGKLGATDRSGWFRHIREGRRFCA